MKAKLAWAVCVLTVVWMSSVAYADPSEDGAVGDLAVLADGTSRIELAAEFGDGSGDLDFDGFVGQNDLDTVLGIWGQYVGPDAPADVTGDSFVGQGDLDAVLGAWGTAAPDPDPGPGPVHMPIPGAALLGLVGLAMVGLWQRRRA